MDAQGYSGQLDMWSGTVAWLLVPGAGSWGTSNGVTGVFDEDLVLGLMPHPPSPLSSGGGDEDKSGSLIYLRGP